MNGLWEKCEKSSFWAFWANLVQFLAKLGKRDFFQKRVWNIFPCFWVLTNCKVLEKCNEWILRYFSTYKRMDERTGAKFKVLLNSSMNQIQFSNVFTKKKLLSTPSSGQMAKFRSILAKKGNFWISQKYQNVIFSTEARLRTKN